MERNIHKIGKELFITSDEEIKEDKIIYFQKGKKYIQQDGVVILAGKKETNGMVIVDPKNTRGIGHYSKDWNPKAFKLYAEPKQKTLEEVARASFNLGYDKGAKWQQERMYSKEEVRRIASRAFLIKSNNETILEDFDKWFEQFKKK